MNCSFVQRRQRKTKLQRTKFTGRKAGSKKKILIFTLALSTKSLYCPSLKDAGGTPLFFFTPRRQFRSTLEMRQGRRAHARCLRNQTRDLFSIGSVGAAAHCKDPLCQSPTPLDNLVCELALRDAGEDASLR
jgi:hypothetical protein